MDNMKKGVLSFGKRRKAQRIFCLFLAFVLLTSCLMAGAVEAGYETAPEIKAEGAVMYERNSAQIIYEKNPDERLYPASTTKIMTALIALERGNLDERITVSEEAIRAVPEGSSLAGLKIGEELTLYELLLCLLVPSGNDAANAIAVAIGGSIDGFVQMMNDRAVLLDCQNTHFCNPHGYHDDDHYTSAADLLKMTLAALEYPLFEEICGMEQAIVPATNLAEERIFNSTNYMISSAETSGYLYPECTGGKTGSTTPAGRCLVAFAEKNNTRLISVMLKSTTEYSKSGIRQIMSFLDTADMFDWVFNNFRWNEVIRKDSPIAEVKVALSRTKDFVVLCPQTAYSTFLYKNIKAEEVYSRKIVLQEDVEAPVKRGDVLGTLTVYCEEEPVQTIQLLAMEDIERSPLLFFLQQIQQTLRKAWVKWALLGLIFLLVLYILVVIRRNVVRRRKVRSRKKQADSSKLTRK